MKPEFGLFFWTVVIFLAFFLIMRKMAWGPIMQGLRDREESIAESLSKAEQAREEMTKLKADNDALLKDAQEKRRELLNAAETQSKEIIAKAKTEAAEAAAKEMEKVRQQIEGEKRAALAEIKDTAAGLAIQVAEKILRNELDDKKKQEELAKKLVSELSEN